MLTTVSFDECPDCEFAQDIARCRPSRALCSLWFYPGARAQANSMSPFQATL